MYVGHVHVVKGAEHSPRGSSQRISLPHEEDHNPVVVVKKIEATRSPRQEDACSQQESCHLEVRSTIEDVAPEQSVSHVIISFHVKI